jgi:hypothetical protein
MNESEMVTCCECGVLWSPLSGGVMYRKVDDQWWCANFLACRKRQLLALRGDAACRST